MHGIERKRSESWAELLPRLAPLFDLAALEVIRSVHAVGFHDGCITGREDATLGWIDTSRRLFDRLGATDHTGCDDDVG